MGDRQSREVVNPDGDAECLEARTVACMTCNLVSFLRQIVGCC